MTLSFGKTAELTNTKYASLAAVLAYYEAQQVLNPLQAVISPASRGDSTLADKLEQILISMLCDCKYISEVNTKLRPERILAQVKRIDQFAEQSTLAIALDELTQMNLEQLQASVRQISDACSHMRRHDWRGFLVLDFDLSGLPCGKQAEGSERGYFSGKKTLQDGNWPVSAPSITKKRFGPTSFLGTIQPCNASNLLSWL